MYAAKPREAKEIYIQVLDQVSDQRVPTFLDFKTESTLSCIVKLVVGRKQSALMVQAAIIMIGMKDPQSSKSAKKINLAATMTGPGLTKVIPLTELFVTWEIAAKTMIGAEGPPW